ncbi:hypothetical protein EBO15_28380 [Actinomadura harenae]|uniref:Uncharacterized protein n=2 Tax=Actinomadura harenae TaxID=2483351 RepID=A0A3M2LS29_9ACTN|nr:hypothetical protein EBO15_28380 [Actinomadura harenae]
MVMTNSSPLARNVGRITDRAIRTTAPDLARLLLTVLALVPYLLGWLAGVMVTATLWTWAALVVGWHDGHRTRQASAPAPPADEVR